MRRLLVTGFTTSIRGEAKSIFSELQPIFTLLLKSPLAKYVNEALKTHYTAHFPGLKAPFLMHMMEIDYNELVAFPANFSLDFQTKGLKSILAR